MSGCRTAGRILKRPKGNKDGVYVADTQELLIGMGGDRFFVLAQVRRHTGYSRSTSSRVTVSLLMDPPNVFHHKPATLIKTWPD